MQSVVICLMLRTPLPHMLALPNLYHPSPCLSLQMVAALPLDCLVLETDAPALGPDKDTPNVPANIVIAAREVAKIKGLPLDQVVQITTENAMKLFTKLQLQAQPVR